MKNLLLFSILVSLTAPVFASKSAKEGIFVYDPDKILLQKFKIHTELTIDHVQPDGYEVFGPDGLKEFANTITGNYIAIDDSTRDKGYMDSVAANYPTNEDDEKTYKDLVAQYPNLVSLESIGKTGAGRDIWVIKISDNVQVDEKEPEFAYIANMHGNEVVGRRLMVRLLKEMIAEYQAGTPEFVQLIDNNEIFFMPTLNPDGYAKRRRGNDKWTDINRDFPDFASSSDNQNTTDDRAPETIAMMNFHAKRHIVLSGSFHDGAVVVNYPWDTTKARPPLHQMIREISLEYASFNEDMKSSYNFTDGVTNGFDWYEVNGGVQDWAYYYHGDLMITLELSNNKWPRFSEIDNQYKLNRDSMVAFMKRIDQGAGFTTQNADDKGKVKVVELTTEKLIGEYPYFQGEFYKILPEGSYRFDISSEIDNTTRSIEISVTHGVPIVNGNLIHL